jgi:hypothetical protein
MPADGGDVAVQEEAENKAANQTAFHGAMLLLDKNAADAAFGDRNPIALPLGPTLWISWRSRGRMGAFSFG